MIGGTNDIIPLDGYRPAKPMVYAGIFPVEGDDYQILKDSIEKLQLNDPALIYSPEVSHALIFGFSSFVTYFQTYQIKYPIPIAIKTG